MNTPFRLSGVCASPVFLFQDRRRRDKKVIEGKPFTNLVSPYVTFEKWDVQISFSLIIHSIDARVR
jgi:hypothetical protein